MKGRIGVEDLSLLISELGQHNPRELKYGAVVESY